MKYDAEFYARNLKFQAALGKEIIPFMVDKYNPRTVIDFGCGCGKLLSMFGIDDVIGINGDWPENLQINSLHVLNLSNLNSWPMKYDLVISLEVAEHLPKFSAYNFIKTLISAASGPVMFSAAVPGQGGIFHINEQPHKYWHEKFAKHDYKPLDIIRPVIKDKKSVPFWYRENIFIYER
jgi:hypothetical protein